MYIKSPLNYTGGKSKILSKIIPLFPDKINNLVDLFCGGCNVGVNVKSTNYYFNDNLYFLMDIYKTFKEESIDFILTYIDNTIKDNKLNFKDKNTYNVFRDKYNRSQKYPLDLFILICFSFNHTIRFNSNKEYNSSFGLNKSKYNKTIEQNLILFTKKIKDINPTLSAVNFNNFDFDFLTEKDFVYIDPPYLITNAVYNEKGGFIGWDMEQELQLLNIIDELNNKNIKFALSNVLDNKNKENKILKEWVNDNNYYIHNINIKYDYCSYQSKNKGYPTNEVLITNYLKKKNFKELF